MSDATHDVGDDFDDDLSSGDRDRLAVRSVTGEILESLASYAEGCLEDQMLFVGQLLDLAHRITEAATVEAERFDREVVGSAPADIGLDAFMPLVTASAQLREGLK